MKRITFWANEIESVIDITEKDFNVCNGDIKKVCNSCNEIYVMGINSMPKVLDRTKFPQIVKHDKFGCLICNAELVNVPIESKAVTSFPLVYGLYDPKGSTHWCEPKLDESEYINKDSARPWYEQGDGAIE